MPLYKVKLPWNAPEQNMNDYVYARLDLEKAVNKKYNHTRYSCTSWFVPLVIVFETPDDHDAVTRFLAEQLFLRDVLGDKWSIEVFSPPSPV